MVHSELLILKRPIFFEPEYLSVYLTEKIRIVSTF